MKLTINIKIILITVVSMLIMFIIYSVAKINIMTVDLELEANNIAYASVISLEDNKEFKSFNNDTKNIKLNRFTEYTIKYTADNGYANGEQSIYTDANLDKIIIQPHLSEEALTGMLDATELEKINNIINAKSGITDYYVINQGRLFGNGDIYGTTLTYKGDDYFNTDTQRVVLTKKEGIWTMVGEPGILLNIYNNPGIDSNILEEINLI